MSVVTAFRRVFTMHGLQSMGPGEFDRTHRFHLGGKVPKKDAEEHFCYAYHCYHEYHEDLVIAMTTVSI